MTGALWAKRGERDISREARDERKKKLKPLLAVHIVLAVQHWRNSKNNGLRTGALSSPRLALGARVALRSKYRVPPAWLIKHLSCSLKHTVLILLEKVKHIGWDDKVNDIWIIKKKTIIIEMTIILWKIIIIVVIMASGIETAFQIIMSFNRHARN